MSRTQSRLSRGLIGILTIIIAIGFIAYIHNTSKSIASDKPKVTSAMQSSAVLKESAVSGVAGGKSPIGGAGAANSGGATSGAATSGAVVSSAPKTEISISPASISPPSKNKSKQAKEAQVSASSSSGSGASISQAAASPTTAPSTQPAIAKKEKSAGTPAVSVAAAKAKLDAGNILGARRDLSDALIAGGLSDSESADAKATLKTISAELVFSPRRFADDEYGGTYNVQPGDLLQKIAAQHDITWQYLCRVNGLADPKKLRSGATIKVLKGPFHALVEKHKFNLEIWVGGEPYTAGAAFVTSFPVGLGKDDSTPTGKWMVQPGNKIKNPTYYSPRGEGVIDAGDPKNPLGQYWLGLMGVDGHAVGKTSYGIHGNIDANSIGKQESMGCIRMNNEDIAQVFELLVEGKSTVTVRD